MRARSNAVRHLLWLGLTLAGLGLLLGGGLPVLRAVAAPPASPVAAPPTLGPGGSPVSDPAHRIRNGVLDRMITDGTATYIVVLAEQADTRNTLSNWADKGQFVYTRRTALATGSQAGILTYLDAQQQAGHVTAYDSLWIINAVVVTSDASVLDYLANLPEVGSIWPDGPVRALGAPGAGGGIPGGLPGVEHNIAALGAPQVWALGVRGAGVTVASLDTGVAVNHPALARKYRGWNSGALLNDYNWWDAVHGQTTGPYDDVGNGSHAMGLVLGAESDGSHAIGVAPDARWIAVKMLDESGNGTDAQGLRAMQWVLAPTRTDGTVPRPDLRPQVVSNAWGGVCADAVTRGAVTAWTDAGIFAGFAAGDSGTLTAPAAFPEAFAVGAVDDRSGFVAAFSGSGPSCYGAGPRPQILAPGVDIHSSVGGRYSDGWSGTALAQAQVAGVAALLLSARPDLTVAQVRAALTSTAAFVGYMGSRPNDDYGWGLADALAAIQAVRPPGSPTPAPSDTPTPRPPSPTLTSLPTPGPAPGCTALFDDVPPGHWAFGYVRWFFCRGYVTGFGNNRFGPDQATSRAQFAKMIVLSHAWPLVTPATPTFSDVPRGFWAYSFIETAHAHGVVSGYADGTFQPTSNITRVQMAKILVQSQGWTPVTPAVPTFADVDVGHWAYPWVETLVRRRVVSGYGDGTFRPDQKVTRAQLSKMLYLTLIQP